MENTKSEMDSKIDWSPLKQGGTNIKTHKLVEIDSQRMEYKGTIGFVLFGLLFIVVGLGLASFVFIEGVSFWIIMFGLLFSAPGAYILKIAFSPIVFDKTEGYFWKGKVSPRQASDISEIKTIVELEKIHGIQVIKEFIKDHNKGRDTSYYSYEINLILHSGDRLNVVDYGKEASILEDASQLSKFLNVRVLTNS